MKLQRLVDASRAVAGTRSRLRKAEHLAELLRELQPGEVEIAVAFLVGEMRQGRIGVGPAALEEAWPDGSADVHGLTLREVDATFDRIAGASGPGSTATRVELLAGLLGRATPAEQEFLGRLVVGELRQGALEGVMAEAVAQAAGADGDAVRRGMMLSGDLKLVARRVLLEGAGVLEEISIRLFRPLQPMLAETADDIAEALDSLGPAALEFKLDGARVQAHKDGDEVRLYSRRLHDVTASIPEVAEAVAALAVGTVVLDGEVLALRQDGTPHPFQTTMRRFGRKQDVARMRRELPLAAAFFDVLHVDGEDLVDRPGRERYAVLDDLVPADLVVTRTVPEDVQAGEGFLERALDAGHEGIMAKSLAAPYEAGRRGANWLKIKPAHTLDLVVLAAEWGHGRRRGWLSNLHLGARGPEGSFVMLGKTFKGMTDAMLEWQTEALQELEVSRDGNVVEVRPELVVEVAFNDVQASPQYPAGLALRFARVVRYRPDKAPEQADTVATVRAIHERQARR